MQKMFTLTHNERLRDQTGCSTYSPTAPPWNLYGVPMVWQRQNRSRQLATVWDILQLPLHYGHPGSPPPPCFELPEWNRTIVIDRKAEETPHLTSTHAESNYTPSASALAPAWGFQRARGERMGVGIKAVEWLGGGRGGVILAEEREKYAPKKKIQSCSTCIDDSSLAARFVLLSHVGQSRWLGTPVIQQASRVSSPENNSTRLLSQKRINNYKVCLLGHKGPSFI